jgi:predicted GNAT family acetyltransferase
VGDSRTHADAKLDEALEETFPASDPPANTVETGIGTGGAPRYARESVIDNAAASRFELADGGETAFLVYERAPGALRLIHTEVPPAMRGQHAGDALVEAALEAGRAAGLRIIAICPFAQAYLRKHSAAR